MSEQACSLRVHPCGPVDPCVGQVLVSTVHTSQLSVGSSQSEVRGSSQTSSCSQETASVASSVSSICSTSSHGLGFSSVRIEDASKLRDYSSPRVQSHSQNTLESVIGAGEFFCFCEE